MSLPSSSRRMPRAPMTLAYLAGIYLGCLVVPLRLSGINEATSRADLQLLGYPLWSSIPIFALQMAGAIAAIALYSSVVPLTLLCGSSLFAKSARISPLGRLFCLACPVMALLLLVSTHQIVYSYFRIIAD